MTAPSSGPGWVAPPLPLPCERCGEAPSSARHLAAGRKVCGRCLQVIEAEAARARRGPVALWPTVLIFLIGLLSPVAPPMLAGITWWQLGDRRRVRDCILLSAAGALCAAGRVASVLLGRPPEQDLWLMVAGLLVAFFAALPLWKLYARHRQQGGPRASLWIPVLLGLALNLAIGTSVALALLASGRVDLQRLVKNSQLPLSAQGRATDERPS